MDKRTAMQRLKERAAELAPGPCGPGHPVVWGEGSLDAQIAIVGEAPGDTEEKLARPFVGPAGRLLERELEAVGLARERLWITNVVKCRPTREAGRSISNRPPTPTEARDWLGFLMEELEIVSPRIIVCAGALAAKAVIRWDFELTRERGRWFDGPFSTRAIATYHPAYVLRRLGQQGDTTMEAFRADLRMVRMMVGWSNGRP